jgi:hypothetical protein
VVTSARENKGLFSFMSVFHRCRWQSRTERALAGYKMGEIFDHTRARRARGYGSLSGLNAG